MNKCGVFPTNLDLVEKQSGFVFSLRRRAKARRGPAAPASAARCAASSILRAASSARSLLSLAKRSGILLPACRFCGGKVAAAAGSVSPVCLGGARANYVYLFPQTCSVCCCRAPLELLLLVRLPPVSLGQARWGCAGRHRGSWLCVEADPILCWGCVLICS